MSKQMLELAKGLREAAHYCTELSELEKHCNDIAGKLDSMARQCSAASAQPANEPTDLYSYVPDIVKNAMLTMWNYICDDSKCHPLDIEHGRGKVLTFEPKHWAQFTGEMVQRNIRDLFAGAEPQTASSDLVSTCCEGLAPEWMCRCKVGEPAPDLPPQETKTEDSVVAWWMARNGYATGHGDTIADMLDELEAQAKLRSQAEGEK